MVMVGGTTVSGNETPVKTIENPQALLTRRDNHKKAEKWGLILIGISVIGLILSAYYALGGITNAIGNNPSPDAASRISVCFLFAFIATAFVGWVIGLHNSVKLNYLKTAGLELVEGWLKVLPQVIVPPVPDLDAFPQNAVELGSCKNEFGRRLSELATTTTNFFDHREKAEKALEKITKETPKSQEWPSNIPFGELKKQREGRREAVEKALKGYKQQVDRAEVALLREQTQAEIWRKALADLWELVNKLGKFYDMNVLPINPETGKPFDDWNKFREFLRGKKLDGWEEFCLYSEKRTSTPTSTEEPEPLKTGGGICEDPF